jgi:hypothetical protein
MPIATFSRRTLFDGDTFGVADFVNTILLVLTATLRPPSRRHVMLRFSAVGRPTSLPAQSLPPVAQWFLEHGATSGESFKAAFESYLISYRSSTSSNVSTSVVRLVMPVF